MGFDAIYNFLAISPALAAGGQPTEDELAELARQGFEVVVNLGLSDPRYCLADEAGTVARLGMRYHAVPVAFDAPRAADLERFFAIMDACRGARVFVHCAANKRVTSFLALYGEARLGWSRDDADALARRVWAPDPTWAAFIAASRQRLGLERVPR